MEEQKKWALRCIRVAAIFGLIGTIIGSSMSGQGDYALRPIHAHVELVGWLSVFAWGIFYYIVPVKHAMLMKVQVITGLLGALGLTLGMYLYNFYYSTATMVFFIVGGTILLGSFFLFLITTWLVKK